MGNIPNAQKKRVMCLAKAQEQDWFQKMLVQTGCTLINYFGGPLSNSQDFDLGNFIDGLQVLSQDEKEVIKVMLGNELPMSTTERQRKNPLKIAVRVPKKEMKSWYVTAKKVDQETKLLICVEELKLYAVQNETPFHCSTYIATNKAKNSFAAFELNEKAGRCVVEIKHVHLNNMYLGNTDKVDQGAEFGGLLELWQSIAAWCARKNRVVADVKLQIVSNLFSNEAQRLIDKTIQQLPSTASNRPRSSQNRPPPPKSPRPLRSSKTSG